MEHNQNHCHTNQLKSLKSLESQHYLIIWRWHFYAGLFVAPFLMLLAITGVAMLLFANISGREGERIHVAPRQIVQPVSIQAQKALDKIGSGSVVQYIAPRANDQVAVFRVNHDDMATMVAINPYTAEVVKTYPRNSDWYHLMDEIHGDLLLGKTGDFLIETAASLGILMIFTGFYLWYVKRKNIKNMLCAPIDKGRSGWCNIHGLLGTWVSLILLTFLLSGLAWAGIWGGKIVQAWSQFPAGKWGVAPLPVSDVVTHGQLLNDGKTKEVPWMLELTPMPVSGTTLGEKGISPDVPITLETVDRFAREIGFQGRYQLNLPQGDTGVWTLSQDSMSYDGSSPTADRTVHIDKYSGNILADIRYDDYNWFGKFMAVSIALHMGTLGWWSISANVLFCLAVMMICISGIVMWWKRRPGQAIGLVPPAQKISLPIWRKAAVLLLLVAAIFPTAALAIVVIALLDYLLVSRVPVLMRWFK